MYIIIDKKEYLVKEANNPLSRFLGLMGKRNISYGVLFKKCNSIHTFFMKENIDVIGLDENNRVIYHAINVSKNKIITIKNKRKKTSILELPNNTSQKIKISDALTFVSK